jgi:hypothetical protein
MDIHVSSSTDGDDDDEDEEEWDANQFWSSI